MDNRKYLASIGVTDEATRSRCLDVMAKYEDNKWWEPDVDPRKFAYNQLAEPIMLCQTFNRFHKAASLLLNRPIYTHEFGICAKELEQEAEQAWKRYQMALAPDTDGNKLVKEGLKKLFQYAEERDKPVSIIEIPLAGVEEK
jgi:hypothetical protein